MKKSILFTVTLVCCISNMLHAQNEAENRLRNDWAWLTRFQVANATLGLPKAGENRVVFMGNSITEGWTHADPGFFANRPYI